MKYKDKAAKNGQLATAVKYLKAHPNTRLVSLMIGANDGFLCQEKGGCTTLAEFNAVLTKISKNVTHTLKAIRGKAHYTGQIVIVQYYSLDYSNSVDTLRRARSTARCRTPPSRSTSGWPSPSRCSRRPRLRRVATPARLSCSPS